VLASPPLLGSTGSTTLVLAVVLVALGLAMLVAAVWLVRATRRDLPLLGPLEVMGDRRFARRDAAGRAALLAAARPPGAPEPAPIVPIEDGPVEPVQPVAAVAAVPSGVVANGDAETAHAAVEAAALEPEAVEVVAVEAADPDVDGEIVDEVVEDEIVDEVVEGEIVDDVVEAEVVDAEPAPVGGDAEIVDAVVVADDTDDADGEEIEASPRAH
jgi:hypothetical protein